MTLKEKFYKKLDWNLTGMHQRKIEVSEELEKIADDYAIDFAEWLNTLEAKYLIEDMKIIGELNKNPTAKELLEIFKKEKGYV